MYGLKFNEMLPLIEEILTLSSQEPTSAFIEFHTEPDNFHIITDCSTDFSFFLGYRRSEIIGKSAFDLTPKEFHEDMRWSNWSLNPDGVFDVNRERWKTLPDGLFFKHWLRSDGSEAPSALLIGGEISPSVPRRIVKCIPVKELPLRNPPLQPYEFRWLRRQKLSVVG